MSISTQAIVAYESVVPGEVNLKVERLNLRELREDEVLVRMVATGICHTDVVIATIPESRRPKPIVLGHEGAGIVERVGSKVQNTKPGDSVLLSFSSCATCNLCTTGHPAYCPSFNAINVGGEADTFTKGGSNEQCAGMFFGQSSFAELSIVRETSVVNVTSLIKSQDELKLFAPMGCGFATGAGTVVNLAKASKLDSITVIGLGGVGLAAIMGAKVLGCHTIIGIDRVASRLALAKELGATHIIDTTDAELDVVAKIQSFTNDLGSSITIDTTGNMKLIESGLEFTGRRGQMILLGVTPPTAMLNINTLSYFQTGKTLVGSIVGDIIPSEFIPKMIKWYRDGEFPIEKLIKYYALEDFQTAFDESHSGVTVKPVIAW